ncbi:MAG: hypothetical protein ABR962_06760 [Candidatus Bathyarchaeia archaeon]
MLIIKRSVKAASIVLVVVVAITVAVALYVNGAFVSAEQLQTQGFVSSGPKRYTVDFYKNNNEVFEVNVQLSVMDPEFNLATMMVYFSNHSGTLDSLTLSFTSPSINQFIRCYLETPTSVPATVTTRDGLNTNVQLTGLGKMGIGSFYLQFLIQPFQANNFEFQVNFALLQTGLPPIRQTGTAQIQLPTTFTNATT